MLARLLGLLAACLAAIPRPVCPAVDSGALGQGRLRDIPVTYTDEEKRVRTLGFIKFGDGANITAVLVEFCESLHSGNGSHSTSSENTAPWVIQPAICLTRAAEYISRLPYTACRHVHKPVHMHVHRRLHRRVHRRVHTHAVAVCHATSEASRRDGSTEYHTLDKTVVPAVRAR